MKKKVMFITTEIATDMYLSRLIKELKKNNLAISAVGLANIKKANPDFFLQSPKISCIGIYEAKKVAYKFFKFYKELKEWIKKITPDILVLADSPELNLRIAKYAKTKLNLKKILYFIPPTVWAWRKEIHHKKICR
jgi:lipid-A-disaccharide synthase